MLINLKTQISIFILSVFCNLLFAQETTPNIAMQANTSVVVTPTHISSIASRLAELPPYVDVVKEASDRRSLGNRMVIGEDRQTQDDYFVRNTHESSQSIQVAPPTLVFDAYSSGSQPTDPSMAIGPNHVFVVFNTGFVIYDKSGNLLAGPLSPNPTIFPNSGCCDLTVSYDAAADRWVLTFLGGGAQVAVSDGPDPINDGWYNYNIGAINDYQKLSVWSDGYYLTDNTGSANKVWALERAAMLAGNSAQILGFNLPGIQTSGFYSPQALNVSDANMPADGGATFLYLQDDAWGGVANDHIKLWTLDMDWVAGNGTMNAAIEIPATEFISVFDGGSFSNLAQPGGGPDIDALQATIMNQAQFRKFDTYNSALFNFVVDTDASSGELAGVRWFELRQDVDNGPWSVYQEGTYTAPDGRHAWNASMIMDGAGNIGMGYTSMAGPTTPNPTNFRVSSYYTGRFNGDANGVMTASEELISAGNANIPGLRYGDYSKIDIDPSDDSTFWFINEYMNSGRRGVVGAFQLEALTLYTEVPLFQVCDDDGTSDDFTEFDLDSQNIVIATVGGIFNPDLTVTYHISQPDAEAGTIPSLSSPYTNIVSPEIIWVRVEDDITGSYGVFQMELRVNPLPTPVVPSDFIDCDIDNDGIIAFDLTSKDAEILDGQTGVVISYHDTLLAAQDGSPVLASPHTNSSTPIQTIYARAEFTATGCFDIVPMNLVVNPTPIIPTSITPIEICDINLDNIEAFDLTERASEIIGVQNPVDYTLTYYETLGDADSGTGEITTPNAYQNTSDPQTIWVRLENNNTGCYDVIALDLIVNPAPAIADPISDYQLCDNDQDGTEDFDLTSKNTEIENGLPNITLTYYNTQSDAELGDPATEIPTPNAYPITGAETIWVRAVNLENCVTVSSFELIIDTVSDYTPVPLFQVNDDDGTPDGFTEFELDLQITPIITAGDPNLTVTYHLTEADAEAGTIPSQTSPYTNSINPEFIWVRVEDSTTGCFGNFEMELQVIIPSCTINDDNIQEAVDLWISDPTTAEATYGNISNWDTSCVTDMSELFQDHTTFNDDISQWDVSSVTDMRQLFLNAASFNQDIGDWNLSSVIYIREMFSSAISFNQPISDWDVSGVTDMNKMFFNARDFNNPIENWDVSNVTSMFAMFQAAEDFDQDIGGWDVSNVTDMRYMLDGADSFDQDIGDWNVANVREMGALLNNTMSFNQDIGSWDVSSVINMNLIFNNSGISTANYDAILQGWASQTVQNNVILGAVGLFYCNAEAERQSLIDNFGWTFGGDAIDPNCGDGVISCGDYVIEPFCAGPEGLIFENCSSSSNDPNCNETAFAGPDYGCTFTQPYPSWFYLQIEQTGILEFDIIQNTGFDDNGNPIGTGLDVDFIVWGPFTEGDNLCDPSLLQSFNEIDCSYSIDSIENVTIPNGQSGEIYVLLITNYSDDPGFIKLVQTNTDDPGAGSTNCEIITTCSIEIDGGDQDLCNVTETTLTTTTSGAIESYQWYLNDNEIVGATSNILTVSDPGIYKVVADGIDCDQPAQDQVLIEIPQVDAGEDLLVCQLEDCVTLTGATATSIEDFIWSSSSDGTFTDVYTLNPTYCFSEEDYLNGVAVLTLTGLSYTDDDCLVQDSLIISIGNTIDYTEIPVYEQFDDLVLDGFTAFYLESQSSIITGGNPALTVTYYETQADANLGTNALASAYTNLSNPQTIYVRVEDNTTGCYEIFDMELLVITPPPSIDYTFCSEDTPLEFNPPLYASASILVSDTSADHPSDTGIIGTGLGEYRLESVVLNVQGEMAQDLAFYLQPTGTSIQWELGAFAGGTDGMDTAVDLVFTDTSVNNYALWTDGAPAADYYPQDGAFNTALAGLDINGEWYLIVQGTGIDTALVNSFCINWAMSSGEAPEIFCPADFTAENSLGECGAVVNFTLPIAIDTEDGVLDTSNIEQTGGIETGGFFPVGDTDVTFTATDSHGNQSSCTFVVTVIDVEAPEAICQNITVLLDDTGNSSIIADQINVGSNDNCGVESLAINVDTFDCSNVGANEVTLTVTDIHGNIATCVATVTVLDNTAPIAVCQDITLELGDDGTVTIDPLAIDGGSSDACGIASYELDIDTLDCSNLGNTTVTLTVMDTNGNQNSCAAIVTLEDNSPPVLVCSDVTVELNQDGVAFITPSLVADITDNCGTSVVTINVQEVSCADIGTPLTVTVFANDGSGNSASCSAVVTVVDLLAPEIVCPDDQVVNLDPNGTHTLGNYIADGSATATDNCTDPVTIFTQDPAAGSVLGFGTQVITFTAQDQYGNVSTCSFELDIQEILGVGNVEDFASLVLYPNPADSKVNLSNPRQIDLNNVTIYDLTGRIVNKVDLSTMGSEITIDISTLANATYMLVIRGDQGISTKQLIVNNY